MKPDQPAAWQQNAVFEFFASVRLAMLLIGVLIVASIVGTIYESSLDAKVAAAYIYRAPWFNGWLLLLGVNLVFSAFSRYPWRRHHTGFLITHLGIILVLAGAWIGRKWGVEGTMTVFKNEPPSNLLMVDQRVLQIAEEGGASNVVPLEVINRKPTRTRPRDLVTTDSGWKYEAVDYSSSLDVKMEARPVTNGGSPAIHVALSTAMMGQKPDAWLLADDTHGVFELGLASVRFQKGVAPAPIAVAGEPVDIEETIFAFANSPADQVGKSLKGGSTGAQVRLTEVSKESKGKVVLQLDGKEQSFEVAGSLGQSLPVAGTPFTFTVDQYWPDFRIKDGKPDSVSDEPNNPCILVTLRGHAIPAQPLGTEAGGKNFVTIFTDEKGALTYQLSSRKNGISTGKIEMEKPVTMGWADWQLVVDQALPQAEEHMSVQPAANGKSEGVLVLASHAADRVEQWVPFGWQVPLPTGQKPTLIGYGFRQHPLPISLQLSNFEVDRDEGTDAPAGFKSTLVITAIDGTSATGQCWMNNPISFPDSWVNTFSGMTYKLSQASWNPENLSQSTIQILRDPGWGLKWIGSLLVVAGIFSLFYLRPSPQDAALAAPSAVASQSNVTRQSREPVSI